MEEDAQLLRQYGGEGSEKAFAELVRRHANLVHSVAMRRLDGDFHGAKDVTQLVFASLARKAASLTDVRSLSAWLYVAAVHASATAARGAHRRKLREERTHAMDQLLNRPDAALDWDHLRPALDRAMLGLKGRDREALVWRYFDAQPLAKIGQKLGVSENAAGMRVNRALDRLRRSLLRRGIGSSAAALGAMLAARAVSAAPPGLAESVSKGALAAAAAPGWWKFFSGAKAGASISATLWVTAALSIPAIGWAAYELRAARAAQDAMAADTAAFEAQGEHLAVLQRTVLLAERRARPPARAPSSSDPKADFRRFMTAYPQVRPMILAETRLLAAQIYGSFFRSAHLTPFQIRRFEESMAEKWLPSETISPAGLALTGQPLPSALELRGILGDPAFAQFQEYNRSVRAHYWANMLADRLPIGSSLSPEGMDRVAQALADNHMAQTGDPAAPAALVGTDWEAASQEIQSALPASEWKAVEPGLLSLQALALATAAQPSRSAGAGGPSQNP